MAFLGLNSGEFFVLVVIVVAVVSAPYWPRLGGAIAVAIVGKSPKKAPDPGSPGEPPG